MATIKEYFENDQYASFTGIELLEAKKGYAKCRMKIKPMHLNGGGVCQGGAIFTLADFAFAIAVNSHARLTFSINSTINIFKSENKGDLYAEAYEIFDHKHITSCEVKITNENGDLIATFSGTGYRKNIDLPFNPLE